MIRNYNYMRMINPQLSGADDDRSFAVRLLNKFFTARMQAKNNYARLLTLMRSGVTVPDEIKKSTLDNLNESGMVADQIILLNEKSPVKFLSSKDITDLSGAQLGIAIADDIVISGIVVVGVLALAVIIGKIYMSATATSRALGNLEKLAAAKAAGTINDDQYSSLTGQVVENHKEELKGTGNVFGDISGILTKVLVIAGIGTGLYIGWPWISRKVSEQRKKLATKAG